MEKMKITKNEAGSAKNDHDILVLSFLVTAKTGSKTR